ncbi:MAG: hypothetical protein ACKO5K_04020 [Armatimonadota bacterium]
MRRRRNAASDDTPEEGIVEPVSSIEPAAIEGAESPKPRSRRPRKTVSTDTVAETPAIHAEPTVPAEKPRRTRGGARVATSASAPEEVPAAAPESVASSEPAPTRARGRSRKPAEAPATVEPAPVDAASADAAPAPERSSRRRGRRTSDTTTAEKGVAASVEETPAPESVETPGRRRGRRGKTAEANAEAAPSSEAVQEDARPASGRRTRRGRSSAGEPAEAAESVDAGEAPAGEPRSGRSRGLRRTRTVAAPELMISGGDSTVVEPESDTETEEAGRRRSRGGRRARPAVVEAPLPPEPVRPVYQPLPAEVLARLPEARVVATPGAVELRVDGEPFRPLAFFVYFEAGDEDRSAAERQIRLAYQNGVRLFTFLAHLPWPTRTGERRTDPLDEVLAFVAENAPEAKLLPRLIFSPVPAWIRQHPDEMAVRADGEPGDVSLASRAFWEDEADQALRAAIEHIAQGPHAHRILGFYLEHGEWLYEKGAGYDTSRANTTGFRRWLRNRYRNSVVHLQAAWHDGEVDFDNAKVPSTPPPAGYPDGIPQFLSGRERRWTDFHEYSSDIVAQVILGLAQAAKEASGGRSAVAVSYGYSAELPRVHTGHLSLAAVLASPHVDILTGPFSYSGREPGGSAPMPAPIDSVALAGKLWICEDDTKTHLASGTTPDAYNVQIESVDGTRAVHARNFGAAIAKGTGLSWMDLWGEGWLDDRDTWEFLGELAKIMDETATRRRREGTSQGPDVAVLLDERSLFGVREQSLIERSLCASRDAWARSGARVGWFLQSDLAKPNFPESAKLLVFLNPYHVEPAIRSAIRDRFQDEGRTLAWLYAPGCLDGNVSEMSEVLGMQLRLQPWGSKVGTHLRAGVRSPLVDGMPHPDLGCEARVDPSVCVHDSRAESLGEYPGGSVSMAIRRHPRWQSVFIGEPDLSVGLVRGLCRVAGIPIHSPDDDVCWVGDGFLCVHSNPGGGTAVHLRESACIFDLVYGETLALEGCGARYTIQPKSTRLLVTGPRDVVAEFGAEFDGAPTGLAESETPVVKSYPVDRAVRAETPVRRSEDVALFDAAMARMEAVPEERAGRDGTEEDAAAGTSRSSRRRRRRRGRGGDGTDAGVELQDTLPAVPGDGTETADRSRPTLAELLPESESPGDGELPPIPEEFKPIDEANIGAGPAPRRRRRRGRGGRGGGGGDADAGGAASESGDDASNEPNID